MKLELATLDHGEVRTIVVKGDVDTGFVERHYTA